MAPKKEAAAKKPAPQVIRPVISDSSLIYVPEEAIEDYQERIETGIDWTLLEEAARHHRELCRSQDLPEVPFSEAFVNKIQKSVLNGFLDEDSGLTLNQQWELILPVTLWDNEKFGNEEGKICFKNNNCITDNMVKMIKKAVNFGDRDVLIKEIKKAIVLRVTDSKMTSLDEGLTEFKNLVYLNLCGNYLRDIDARQIPSTVKTLELQANRIGDVGNFVENLPCDLIYLGLARNIITNSHVESLCRLPMHLTALDLSDNDIYDLEPVLDALARLPNLTALLLVGNPCSLCACYARSTLARLTRLKWLDCRQVLPTDRPLEPIEAHPDDLRACYFTFTVFRVMSAPQPPKPEKGAVTTFHVELELPLLDSTRRQFLMFRNHESLTEMMPPPEDEEWPTEKLPSTYFESKHAVGTESSHESDIYNHLVAKNSREICHFTTFESNKIQWNKVMNFQEPTVKIFCPDLVALRNTFRTVVTVRLMYSVNMAAGKQGKSDKKSSHALKLPGELRVTLATIKCALRQPDWSQPMQHFHWDDSLNTNDAIHWGDGDLSVLQYSQAPVKVPKGKQEADVGLGRQLPPENLTCHFGFGIETLKAL